MARLERFCVKTWTMRLFCFRGGEDLRALRCCGDGLLVDDVLAGLHRPDALQGVEWFGVAMTIAIDVGAREQVTIIDDAIRQSIAAGAACRHFAVEDRGVDIAQRHNAHAGGGAEGVDEFLAAAV